MLRFIKVDVLFDDTPFPPPLFLGSMLRGAFGVSLKKVVCINPSYKCEGCFATENCLFYDFYEKKNVFHPFRFDTDLGQENFNFTFYLFEEATNKLPYVLSAFHKMFTEQGIGVNREKMDIKKIICNGKTVYEEGKFDLSNVFEEEFEEGRYTPDIRLSFKTPLRIKYQNKLLRKKPEFRFLIQSIYNRYRELKGLSRERLPFEPSCKEIRADVRFRDITRYSNRQKTKMQIGGIVGEIEYEDVDRESFKLLKLAKIIGVGKQTVFGLGKIEVQEIEKAQKSAKQIETCES